MKKILNISLFSPLSAEEDQGRILPSRIVLAKVPLTSGCHMRVHSSVCLPVTHAMVQLTVCEHSLTD